MLPTIAVISFPGTNCEVESLRAIRRNGMDAINVRWNEFPLSLTAPIGEREVGGYFLPGGFSYEDRGRSGMIAAHDPLIDFLRGESERGKVIIGHCNGAQILVESGLIPLDKGLKMALAKNKVDEFEISNFLNQWIWMKPTCGQHRCAVSDWNHTMHVPIAHGEGRFTTRDTDLIKELKKNDQIAFRYCDQEGNVSDEYPITPNGSMYAIAGICNPAGNVIALMPHPERTSNGDPYFQSMRKWVEGRIGGSTPPIGRGQRGGGQKCVLIKPTSLPPLLHPPPSGEVLPKAIFIDTIITNNEERSLEQLLRKYLPNIKLKQYRYCRCDNPKEFLSHTSNFNPNKEVAYVGRDAVDLGDVCLIRIDDGMTEGVCYVCKGVNEDDVKKQEIQEIFANPHASTLSRLH